MDGQIYLPKMTKVNKVIIITSAALFIAEAVLKMMSTSFYLQGLLGLSAAHLMNGHIYSLVTYPLLSHSIIEVILNCLMLWLMGSEFEANWGTKRYINFLLSVVIGGGVLFLAVSFAFFRDSPIYTYPLVGLSGIVSALCVAYAVIFPERIF
jgi:membrane associated rhomboid family serine protease